MNITISIRILFLLIFSIDSYSELLSQAPQKMSYQAVIRDANDKLLTTKTVGIKISILKDNIIEVYAETQILSTNKNGLLSLEIGGGNVLLGDFTAIDWGSGTYYIKTETDPNGGNNYSIIGSSQLLSVPYALYAQKSGDNQTAVWSVSGNSGTDQKTNFIGTTDKQNLVFKRNNIKAGEIDTFNTSFGLQSLLNNTSGSGNTAIGHLSLNSNKTGKGNTATGQSSLQFNTTGKFNVANGDSALYINTTGYSNVAIGRAALFSNTEGHYNTVSGENAMHSNTTGNYNTASGSDVMYSNVSGFYNTGIGSNALFSNLSGGSNTAVGMDALYHNKTGYYNSALGLDALKFNTTGSFNNAFGYKALYTNTSGSYNLAIGDDALYLNTEGDYNIAIGRVSLYNNTTGNKNVAVGSALGLNTTGSLNTAIGEAALPYNITGNLNTAIGKDALFSSHYGSGNTAIGESSLYDNDSGKYNTAIGAQSYQADTSYSYSTAIGYGSTIQASYQIRMGDQYITSIGGQVGWTTVSDRRFKKDISETIPGLEFIMKLRPVTYHMDMDAIAKAYHTPDSLRISEAEKEKSNTLQSGFIAQEVEQAAKQLNFDFSGLDKPKNYKDYYGLRYAEFVVPIIKAMQQQQQLIMAQNQKIADQNKDNQALQNKLLLLEARLKSIEEKIK